MNLLKKLRNKAVSTKKPTLQNNDKIKPIILLWLIHSKMKEYPIVLIELIIKYSKLTFFDSTILTNKLEELLTTKLFKKWKIKHTNEISFNLLFRQTRDINTNNSTTPSKIFHKLCDNQGSTIVLLSTKYNHIIGGYTNIPWSTGTSPTHGTYNNDPNSFLFVLQFGQKFINDEKEYEEYKKQREEWSMDSDYSGDSDDDKISKRVNVNTYENELPLIFPNKYVTSVQSVFHDMKHGPTFGGGHDLCIYDEGLLCYTYNSGSYVRFRREYIDQYSEVLLGCDTFKCKFTPTQIEVFQVLVTKKN